ncbi:MULTISPECIES: ATP-binding protein [Ferrimonas]|uniref:ATP-binding protein n=1 Tax=Ferrimonas TaxID=44011 RepID=UPI00042140BC|nr:MULTISPECIES: ATP-binding protein [Ferrimonas]USD38069.1 ATP-binding protein [Ferrimonas sp. SCSIO 43195]
MECCITLKGTASYDVVAMMAKSVAAMYQLSALPLEDAGLVELAVAEIGNNVVEHAYGNRPGGSLEIRYRQWADGIEIVLVDEGIAMPEAQRQRVTEPQLLELNPDDPSTWLTSGRGLGIVGQVMDSQSYSREDQRNYFRMTKQA